MKRVSAYLILMTLLSVGAFSQSTETAGKQHKLKEADGSGATGCNFTVENAPSGPPAAGTPIQLPVFVYTCHNTTMAAFAGGMLAMPGAGQYLNNKLVVDQTELKGSWD